MKTSFDAISTLYNILFFEPLSVKNGITTPVYELTKATGEDPEEYVVINSLPIGSGVMQKCIVNVNYHVKDLGIGIPDIERLSLGTSKIIELLDEHQESEMLGILIDYESDEIFREPALSEHYSNIRFSVKIINTL